MQASQCFAVVCSPVPVDKRYFNVRLTISTLVGIASKYVISTLDHCHSRSFAVTTRVKVGRSPAITRSTI